MSGSSSGQMGLSISTYSFRRFGIVRLTLGVLNLEGSIVLLDHHGSDGCSLDFTAAQHVDAGLNRGVVEGIVFIHDNTIAPLRDLPGVRHAYGSGVEAHF